MNLAKAIGGSKDTVRNWESGRPKPRLVVLRRNAVVVVREVQGAQAERTGVFVKYNAQAR